MELMDIFLPGGRLKKTFDICCMMFLKNVIAKIILFKQVFKLKGVKLRITLTK